MLKIISNFFFAATALLAFFFTVISTVLSLAVLWSYVVYDLIRPYNSVDIFRTLAGFQTLVFVTALSINVLLNTRQNKHVYSQTFINLFKTPKRAVSFWLNFEFVLAFVTSLIIIYFSIKTYWNLLDLEFALIFQPVADPIDNFILCFRAAVVSLQAILNKIAILTSMALIFILLAKNHEFIAFIQAICLTFTTFFLLGFHFLGLYQITMLDFAGWLLVASTMACLLCLLDSLFDFRIFKSGILNLKSKFKFKTENNSKQYLLSYVLFLTYSYFINWCLLFYHNIEHTSTSNNIFLWFGLVTGVFIFIALRFCSLALNSEKNKPIIMPIAPLILAAIYLKPLFAVLFLSWKTYSLTFGYLYSVLLSLANPTYYLSNNLQVNFSVGVFIASPHETSTSFFLQAAQAAVPYLRKYFEATNVGATRDALESAAPKLEALSKVTSDPETKAKVSGVLGKIYDLQVPRLPTEKQADIVYEASSDLSRLANNILVCKQKLGSPRSGIVRACNFNECLEIAAQSEVSASTSSTAESTVSTIAQNIIESA